MDWTYPWPIPPGHASAPVWTGHGFRLGKQTLPLLTYEIGSSAWTDELTAFHEDHAGSDHFIDRASRDHALRQIRKHARGPAPVVLEVGCSSGFLVQALRRELPHARLIGSDYVRGPLEQLAVRVPDVPLLQFDLVKCPLPDASVDVVVLLNVLEHIEDDVGAVRQLYRIVKPGGAVVIEVPAGPHLYDVYDKLLMHYRRYKLSGLRRLLEASGFAVAHASGLGALLYPAFRHVKKKNQRYLEAPEEVQKEIVARAIQKSGRNRFCELLMWLERWLRGIVPLPFGIRCLATCVKPRSDASLAAGPCRTAAA
jgi:ubiquinone/menaquinone biosynthesis C-methylase UbiE